MKYRIDAALYDGVGAERLREWQDTLLDLNSDDDGEPPTLTIGRLDDGGAAFLVEPAEGDVAPVSVSVPHARLRSHLREYRDIITRLARADLGAFGMRDVDTLDYAKKLVHDDAGEVIRKALRPAARVSHATARRIFTLVFLMSSELPEAAIRSHRRHGTPQ